MGQATHTSLELYSDFYGPPALLQPEDGGSIDLWNIGILPQHCTASQPRRPRLETPPPWRPQNSHSSSELPCFEYSSSIEMVHLVRFDSP